MLLCLSWDLVWGCSLTCPSGHPRALSTPQGKAGLQCLFLQSLKNLTCQGVNALSGLCATHPGLSFQAWGINSIWDPYLGKPHFPRSCWRQKAEAVLFLFLNLESTVGVFQCEVSVRSHTHTHTLQQSGKSPLLPSAGRARFQMPLSLDIWSVSVPPPVCCLGSSVLMYCACPS